MPVVLLIMITTWCSQSQQPIHKANQNETTETVSLQTLFKWYTKDNKNVYYYGQKIEWLDTVSVKILTGNKGDPNDSSPIFLVDKNGVYTLMQSPWDAYTLLPLEWADHSSFELIDNWFSRDKKYLYFDTDRYDKVFSWIELIDISSLQALWNNYYKDKNNIYTGNIAYSEEYIEWINTRTYDYSSRLEILEWVDYDSFKIIDAQWAEDKNSKYSYGVKQNIPR